MESSHRIFFPHDSLSPAKGFILASIHENHHMGVKRHLSWDFTIDFAPFEYRGMEVVPSLKIDNVPGAIRDWRNLVGLRANGEYGQEIFQPHPPVTRPLTVKFDSTMPTLLSWPLHSPATRRRAISFNLFVCHHVLRIRAVIIVVGFDIKLTDINVRRFIAPHGTYTSTLQSYQQRNKLSERHASS